MQHKWCMRKAVWFRPMSGLRYAAIVSKISADLCLSIALSRCHYLCGFALLYPHRSRPQLFLSSLSSPSPPPLYVTLLKSDRCGVNLQPSLTPSLLRTSRSHCLSSWHCTNYTIFRVSWLKNDFNKNILGRNLLSFSSNPKDPKSFVICNVFNKLMDRLSMFSSVRSIFYCCYGYP